VKKCKFNDYNYYHTHNLLQYKEITEIKGNYAFSSTSGSSAAPAASQDDWDEPVIDGLAFTEDHDVDDVPD
jgi:hypothetical protein